jgi:hypothetical protein
MVAQFWERIHPYTLKNGLDYLFYSFSWILIRCSVYLQRYKKVSIVYLDSSPPLIGR